MRLVQSIYIYTRPLDPQSRLQGYNLSKFEGCCQYLGATIDAQALLSTMYVWGLPSRMYWVSFGRIPASYHVCVGVHAHSVAVDIGVGVVLVNELPVALQGEERFH